MRYCCMKPEWADNEPCPIDTGEYQDCAECTWVCELEDDNG